MCRDEGADARSERAERWERERWAANLAERAGYWSGFSAGASVALGVMGLVMAVLKYLHG